MVAGGKARNPIVLMNQLIVRWKKAQGVRGKALSSSRL